MRNLRDKLVGSEPALISVAEYLATHLLDRHGIGDGTTASLYPDTIEMESCCTHAIISGANEAAEAR